MDKKKYLLLFSNWKFPPRRGMEVTKFCFVFQLNESHWITKYI